MKISAITTVKYNNQNAIKNTPAQRPQSTQTGVYNPIYYTDYNLNISFGKRSPEDFYAQEFNKKHMPETMGNYLYEKFAERSKIAPVQIMQEAYDELQTAQTVDDIKGRFPDKQFQKLRPANYSAATSGVLKKIKDIKAMQDTPEPLFKDGCDDLTTYLVKKIYLEGKTVKEIDKDFATDINEIYELAARVPDETKKTLGKNESAYFSHSTLYNLGIRFPELPFWNSFIATRDDYERTNRVKTITGAFVNADSAEGKAEIARRQTQRAQEPPKPRKYNFKRHEIQQITDNIINSKGETSKALKKSRSNRNIEELTFLQKYWSQIMSVATEKIHLSEELIDFNNNRKAEQSKIEAGVMDKFISGADLTNKESTPFKIFWNERTDLKKHFSTAITDTIMLFSREFGSDGDNPRFQALVDYANGIKPEREARALEHARLQAEYDKLAIIPEPERPSAKAQVEELKAKITKIQPDEFKYIIDGHEIILPFDIELHTKQSFENSSLLLPKKIAQSYKKEIDDVIKDDRLRFCLSTCFERSDDTPDINEIIYSNQELQELNNKVIDAMESKHNADLEATRMSLLKYAEKKGLLTDGFIRENANLDIITVRDNLLREIQKTGEIDEASREIQSIFNQLSKPLSNKEKTGCRLDLFQHLKTFDMNSSTLKLCIPRMVQLISIGMGKHQQYLDEIKSLLGADLLFKDQGPVLRLLLDKNTNPEIKNMIRDHAYQHLIRYYPETVSVIMSDTKEFEPLMKGFPTEMHGILALAKKTLFTQKLRLK